jgi:hypothetical protein
MRYWNRHCGWALALWIAIPSAWAQSNPIGREVAIPRHLENGQEFRISVSILLDFGKQLFEANWTIQEGQGRPLAKGVGTPTPLSDPASPLVFPRNFTLFRTRRQLLRGCHNVPVTGGAGDIVANVFVLGQRFDSITMDHSDTIATKGAVDEGGNFVDVPSFADSRATPGMFGSGYLELVAREITADLRAIESAIQPGQSAALVSKGVRFGRLARGADGAWDTSGVTGLPPQALSSSGAGNPPSLILRPWHQVGNVVSIRQFTTNAFNHHHGIQAEERFGDGVDQAGRHYRGHIVPSGYGCARPRDSRRSDLAIGGSERRRPVCENRLRQLSHPQFAPEQLDVHGTESVQSGWQSEAQR